jgi:phosphoenolpyruvate-protein kinase (PTS system EI component)
VAAAHEAGIALEVCGEAASETVMLPLLVGLGVDEVSVGAARVGEVRGWIQGLRAEQAEAVARAALGLDSPDEVARTVGAMQNLVPALSA